MEPNQQEITMWRNSAASYGTLSKWLHWLIALMIFGLFGQKFSPI